MNMRMERGNQKPLPNRAALQEHQAIVTDYIGRLDATDNLFDDLNRARALVKKLDRSTPEWMEAAGKANALERQWRESRQQAQATQKQLPPELGSGFFGTKHERAAVRQMIGQFEAAQPSDHIENSQPLGLTEGMDVAPVQAEAVVDGLTDVHTGEVYEPHIDKLHRLQQQADHAWKELSTLEPLDSDFYDLALLMPSYQQQRVSRLMELGAQLNPNTDFFRAQLSLVASSETQSTDIPS